MLSPAKGDDWNGDWKFAGPPEYWDGQAAKRIVRVIRDIRER